MPLFTRLAGALALAPGLPAAPFLTLIPTDIL